MTQPNPSAPPATPAPGTPNAPADTPPSGGTPAPENPSPAGSSEDTPLGPEGQRALERMKAELAAEKAKVKELSPLAEQARQAAEAQKSAEQRAEEARLAAEARATKAETDLLRLRIGSENNLPPYLIDLLPPGSEDEMRAKAADLAEKWNGRPTPPPSGAGDAGKSGSAAGSDMNSLLRSAVRGG